MDRDISPAISPTTTPIEKRIGCADVDYPKKKNYISLQEIVQFIEISERNTQIWIMTRSWLPILTTCSRGGSCWTPWRRTSRTSTSRRKVALELCRSLVDSPFWGQMTS